MLARMIITTRAVDLSIASVDGSIPATISYRGVLTDSNGAPLKTAFSAVFAIHDEPVQDSVRWTETREIASDAEGHFTILLGQNIPIQDSILKTSPLYLSIQSGTDTGLTPRAVITNTPTAAQLDAAAATVNRIADVVQDGSGKAMGVRDPGGNIGGAASS